MLLYRRLRLSQAGIRLASHVSGRHQGIVIGLTT